MKQVLPEFKPFAFFVILRTSDSSLGLAKEVVSIILVR